MLNQRQQERFRIMNDELHNICHNKEYSPEVRFKALRLSADMIEDNLILTKRKFRRGDIESVIREYDTQLMEVYKLI